MRERIHVVYDYHDQPRSGVADFEGKPHYFECQFDPAADEYSDVYLLMPVSESTFQPAVGSKAFDVWGFFVRTSSESNDSSFEVEWTSVDAGAVELPLTESESESTLFEYIRWRPKSIVLGRDRGAPHAFMSLQNRMTPVALGIIVNFSKAEAVLVLEQNQILAGYDDTVSIIDAQSAELKNTIDLTGQFFVFVFDKSRSQTLVMHELGVVAVSGGGQELWRYDTSDVLTGWEIVGDQLSLANWETNDREFVDLVTGAPLSRS